MKLALLIDRFDPARGGAERALAQLAQHMRSKQHRVHAFAEQASPAGLDLIDDFHRIVVRRLTRGAKERALGRRLVDRAREEGCDVLVGVRHLPEVDLYWPHGGSHLATLAARRNTPRRGRDAATPIVPRGRHKSFVALERQLLQQGGARLVACPSLLVFEELARHWPAARPRLRLVPNGVDLERFHPARRAEARVGLRRELGVTDDRPLLVLAARNPWLKGFRELVQALTHLDGESWMLLLAGPKRPEPFARFARRAGLSADRLRVRTEVDALKLAAGADLVLLPTWRDSSGLVLLESLAAGTPVITTTRAGAAEVLQDSGVGTVIEHPGRTAQLVDALANWLERLRAGEPDRERVRGAVVGRGLGACLGELEILLHQLAASPR